VSQPPDGSATVPSGEGTRPPGAPPRGLLRRLLDAPRWLYRWHLGRLLGHRFLLLTHRGRRSGRVYRTVLEVVAYDPATGESIVTAGWGVHNEWYRNLEAAAALEVETGGRRYWPEQRLLTPEEVYEALAAYVRRDHPPQRIVVRLFGLRFDGSDRESERVRDLRGVAFRPSGSS
jgi:deazaflavin-dependent oxidoreductase (nitroreductase family)